MRPTMSTRVRQIIDRLLHGLLAVPLAWVAGSILLGIAMLWIDAALADGALPGRLETTVEGARSILTAIAGGLLTSATLLLSLLLVAVQLASSQFSPRTLRDWTGDRTQQNVVGLVFGTFVYCVVILRETKAVEEGDGAEQVVPHLSVLLAVVLGVASLVGVLRAVDRLTTSLQITDVARSISAATRAIIRAGDDIGPIGDPLVGPAVARGDAARSDAATSTEPADAAALDRHDGGWLQQIDLDALYGSLPAGTTITMAAALGSYALPGTPLAWVTPDPGDDAMDELADAFALGPERTMQQDVGFGIVQLVDIAVRALSPGVNDPNTANDVLVHLGAILLDVWSKPTCDEVRSRDAVRLVVQPFGHDDYLRAAFQPILRHGADDADVVATMLATLRTLLAETKRRALVGPTEPLLEMGRDALAAFDRGEHLRADRARVDQIRPVFSR